ncbi:MAG: hypothetical protein ACRCTQ_03390 [Brevinemataceae bacterium]
MKKFSLLLLTLFGLTFTNISAQQTSIQFPRLDFHMQMNQNMTPGISYNAQADIVVGDQSGLIFGLGIVGNDINLQSGINDLIELYTLKLSIQPNDRFTFHTFYGRYKYLGEDKVIPRGFQFNYTPGFDYYGYRQLNGAGIAATFPVLEGRYEPELVVYSDSYNGINYLNLDFLTTFRFEQWFLEAYIGAAAPTIGSIDKQFRFRGGFSLYTALDYANFYLAMYVPAHYRGDKLTFDDIYMRFSQYLLINGFEQTLSITSLGSEMTCTDQIVGANGIPDINIFASLGGRIRDIGFGVEYGFIYGLHYSDLAVGNTDFLISNRFGAYIDFKFLTLTYKLGAFYTLPNSPAYSQDVTRPGELGFYVSVFGAT